MADETLSNLLQENRRFEPSVELAVNANVKEEAYERAASDREAFWATNLVCELAEEIPGMRGVYVGRLRNAHQVEALTANLISINRRYKAHAGVRITDV